MKKISMVVPVHNALKEVKACVKSILKNFDFSTGEVFIVNDCSDLKTSRYLDYIAKKYKDRLCIRSNDINVGFLKTCNNAMESACGDIVVFLNSDCEIPEGFSSKIINCFDFDKEIIVASPISSNSAKYFIPQILPLNIMNKFLQNRKAGYPEIPNAEGFCFCVRKSYVDEFGLFDEIYGVGYCEEVDFCYAAVERGKKCVLIDNLYVKHARNKSFGRRRVHLCSLNNMKFYNKWAEHIHGLELESGLSPIKSIIESAFSVFSPVVTLTIKIRNQFRSNRLMCLKNIFKLYRSFNTKKVVYTCISGNTDIIPVIHDYYDKEWEYICFTDNKRLLAMRKFGMWKIKPMVFSKSDSTRNARWHKTHANVLFPEYERTIWIDANINIKSSYLFDIVMQSEADILVPVHYCRNCLYKEFDIINVLKKDDYNITQKWLKVLNNEVFPQNYGLNETNIIYINHKSFKTDIMEQWWNIIDKFSKRDQLSFSYVLWKNGIKISEISIKNARIDIENFAVYSHNSSNTFTGKVLRKLFYIK